MKVDVIKKYFQSWLDNDVEIVKQTFSENALAVSRPRRVTIAATST